MIACLLHIWYLARSLFVFAIAPILSWYLIFISHGIFSSWSACCRQYIALLVSGKATYSLFLAFMVTALRNELLAYIRADPCLVRMLLSLIFFERFLANHLESAKNFGFVDLSVVNMKGKSWLYSDIVSLLSPPQNIRLWFLWDDMSKNS